MAAGELVGNGNIWEEAGNRLPIISQAESGPHPQGGAVMAEIHHPAGSERAGQPRPGRRPASGTRRPRRSSVAAEPGASTPGVRGVRLSRT